MEVLKVLSYGSFKGPALETVFFFVLFLFKCIK